MKQNRFRHLVALILLMCCMMGKAQIFEVGKYMYYSTDSYQRCVEVIAPVGDVENLKIVNIPSSVTKDGVKYTVNKVGEKAFYGCKNLTSVTIPGSVKSIGDWAFSRCSSLTSINIPSSVTSIGKEAFNSCSSLRSITIPSSVTSIGEEAFAWCMSLTSVTIPSSVKTIGKRAFSRCSSLISINIPNSVKSIGDGAFSNCSRLRSVTIPNSVTSIGKSAFSYCSSLTSITLPSSVTSIGESAFWGCKSLTSITIPSSVTSIGGGAFLGCEKLRIIVLPQHITNISIPSQARIIRKDKADHSLGNNASYKKEEKKEEEVVDNAVVEVPASYPGGEAAILAHIAKNLKYPEIALEQELQGVVTLRFKVEKDGSVGTVTVAKGLSRECDQAAVSVVKTLGRFTPAWQQGEPVAVWYTLPIHFQIQ